MLELRAVVRAVRRPHPRQFSALRRPVAVATLAICMLSAGILHGATARAWPSDPDRTGVSQESVMRTQGVGRAIAVVSSLALSTTVFAQSAVQWRVEDGGNGHWYQCTNESGTWDAMRNIALARGGELASLTSLPENQIAWAAVTAVHGSNACGWIGARKTSGQNWAWSDGLEWSFTNWGPGEPCCGDNGLWVHLQGPIGTWQDHNQVQYPCHGVIEWSADCNADGIVDYGQILAGELEDANANNIPDCCEAGTPCDTCPGDIDESGAVNGVDLAAVLNNWGTNGGKYPRADINGDGTVDASDLAFVLSTWGACP
jgi:hypothetical protein